MMHRERRSLLRRGFMFGRASAMRPPTDRKEMLALIRGHLRHVSQLDKYALLVELGESEGTEGVVRTAALLLGALHLLGVRLPEALRIELASEINKGACRLLPDEVHHDTLH